MAEPVIENENGELKPAGVEEIVAKSVKSTVRELKAAMDDQFDNRIREEIADQCEKSLEQLAKAMEKQTPLNKVYDQIQGSARKELEGSPEYAAYKVQRRKTFDKFLRLAGKTKSGSTNELLDHAKSQGYDDVVELFEKDAHSQSNPGSMGILVPTSMANEIIELRDNMTVIRQLAGQSIRIKGNHRLPRQFSRVSSHWSDESQDFETSRMSLDEDMIYPRKLTTAAVITHELFADAVQDVQGIVTRRMMRDHALEEDVTMLRGEGSAKQPTGLRGFIDPDNIKPIQKAGASSTNKEVRADLVDMLRLVKTNNHSTQGGAWIFNSDTWAGLMNRLSSSEDTTSFAAEMAAGRLLGFPFFETNQIPNNLGGGNESELYFVIRPYMLIADGDEMRLDASRDASYKENGNTVSAFSRDEIVYRLITRSDFYYEYPNGAALRTGVDY